MSCTICLKNPVIGEKYTIQFKKEGIACKCGYGYESQPIDLVYGGLVENYHILIFVEPLICPICSRPTRGAKGLCEDQGYYFMVEQDAIYSPKSR